MPVVTETFYQLVVKPWSESDDTIEVVMTREQALQTAREILEVLEGDLSDPITIAVVGSLKVLDTIEDAW